MPVIFVTLKGDIEDEATGYACGAVDYLSKPVSTSIVRAGVRTHLTPYDQNRDLEDKVRERTAEVSCGLSHALKDVALLYAPGRRRTESCPHK